MMLLDLFKKRTPYLISGILMVVRKHSILTSTTQHLVSCPLRKVPHRKQQQRNNTKTKHNTKKTKHPTHQQQQSKNNHHKNKHTMAFLPTKHDSLPNVIPTRKLRLSLHKWETQVEQPRSTLSPSSAPCRKKTVSLHGSQPYMFHTINEALWQIQSLLGPNPRTNSPYPPASNKNAKIFASPAVSTDIPCSVSILFPIRATVNGTTFRPKHCSSVLAGTWVVVLAAWKFLSCPLRCYLAPF